MKIYEINNGKVEFGKCLLNELETNKTYLVHDVVERGEYRGKLNTYFIEKVHGNRDAYLMTKPDGTKPFAIATNDCERDGFSAFELSKILVEEGNYVVYAYHKKEDNPHDPLHFVILRVKDVHPKYRFADNSLEVEFVQRFDSLLLSPKEFRPVVDHAISVVGSDLPDQLLPKYCFNPNRFITLRLFERNEKGEVESFFSDGRRLILNANSSERYKDKNRTEVIEGGLMRVFFSRKFKDSKHIFVDGKILPPLRHFNVEDYVKSSHIDSAVAQSSIKEIKTVGGQDFYAITNLNGEIRPIYRSTTGYSSFALSDYELEFIDEVNDVTEWV